MPNSKKLNRGVRPPLPPGQRMEVVTLRVPAKTLKFFTTVADVHDRPVAEEFRLALETYSLVALLAQARSLDENEMAVQIASDLQTLLSKALRTDDVPVAAAS